MKKILVVCTIISSAFLFTSCLEDDQTDIIIDPYAALTSFTLGDLNSYIQYKNENGEDTTLVSWVYGANYPFVIDQKTKRVYNNDSLPYGVGLEKVLVKVGCDGTAYIYTDSTKVYDMITTTDSLDFSYPRRILVLSTDGMCTQEYEVRVNVHKVDPFLMVWDSLSAAAITEPVSVIERDEKLFLFGKDAQETALTASLLLDGSSEWSSVTPLSISGINSHITLESIKLFKGCFYAVAVDGGLLRSFDGVNWEGITSGTDVRHLVSADDKGLWAVANYGEDVDSIVFSTDGMVFSATEKLPMEFPLYNVSDNVYPLVTNPYIDRTLLIGYSSQKEDAKPVIWNKLSTEDAWSMYDVAQDSSYSCPALKPLAVECYDNKLYAFGGSGVAATDSVAAFSNFYTSVDNGLTWSKVANTKVDLPKALYESKAPFATIVDSRNYMWIISGGETPVVWRGIINRLSFNE
ncbi:MAG: hypothetical protein IKD40_02090 [Bacteroidaceae bacterium]|nr:hypothetical protein [Bacteroidaceae bacterium]